MKKYFSFKPSVFLLLTIIGVIIIIFSSPVKEGVLKGTGVCLQTLIPSLFPFLCLCSLATNYIQNSIPLSKLLSRAFALPKEALGVFLLSLIGGYPTGPMMVAKLYERGQISDSDARRMHLFCCCSGPSFSIIAVGEGMCRSRQIGFILFACSLMTQIIICLVTRFLYHPQNKKQSPCISSPRLPFSTAFSEAVESSIMATLSLCAYVLLFSALQSLLMLLPLKTTILDFFTSCLEVTNACLIFHKQPIFLAFWLRFGGLSVFFQIKKYLLKTGTNSFYFLLSRLVSGVLNAAECYLLLLLFPQAVPTLAGGIQVRAISYSIPLTIALIFSFCVFMADSLKKQVEIQLHH